MGEKEFITGLVLAMSSSLFIGVSFILTKKGILRAFKYSSHSSYSYLKEWIWWFGLLSMGLGELANFSAYMFAPASLVAPLGSLSVLITTILSSRFLGEHLNIFGKIGCALCILGASILIIHSPKSFNIPNVQDLQKKILHPGFMMYTLICLIILVVLFYYIVPRYSKTNVLVYIAICSIFGSFTVMGSKGLGVAIKQTSTPAINPNVDHNAFKYLITWICIFTIVSCIIVQMNYLNKALQQFNTALVTSVYYVFFTTLVIFSSTILLREWVKLPAIDIFGNICGFLVSLIGVFMLKAFKDINLSIVTDSSSSSNILSSQPFFHVLSNA